MATESEGLVRHDLEAKIVKRCWQDASFRKEFTADPGAAFVKYLEVPVESLPRVVVHEETPGSWHIVLPPKPANASELSENDLEKIASGSSTAPCVPFILAITAGQTAIYTSIATAAAVTVREGW
jgi:hypothetical protein